MAPAFFQAVKSGNIDDVRRMVQASPALAGAKDGNGVSAILLAAYHGKREVASALVDLGAPVDIFEGVRGLTPIFTKWWIGDGAASLSASHSQGPDDAADGVRMNP